jgi:hypothetical protein
MKSLNERYTPVQHDLTKQDLSEMKVPGFFSRFKREITTLASTVVAAGLIVGFAYGLKSQSQTSCADCVEQLDDMPKVGYMVPEGASLYGICESLGVPEECKRGCSRYIAGLNGMNPDNPMLREGVKIAIPKIAEK